MTEREVRVGLDVADSLPDTYRLVAECDDELTEMVLIGTPWAGLSRLDLEAALSGFLGKMLVDMHHGRCSACQRWAAGHPTVANPKTPS